MDEGFGGYRWRGMRDADGNPAVFLTEGGARLDRLVEMYWCYLGIPRPVKSASDPAYPAFSQAVAERMGVIKDWQAGFVESSFNLMSGRPLGKGILLFTNYLTYSDPAYDTGMFDFPLTCADWNLQTVCTGENGSWRPLFEKWKILRTP